MALTRIAGGGNYVARRPKHHVVLAGVFSRPTEVENAISMLMKTV